ncbi:MAG TPA: L,D-transpeptidase family protein [Selenomonadales bacterium]|nr:L,D-transpeptidase family protein [Selenomonadales bacterium]
MKVRIIHLPHCPGQARFAEGDHHPLIAVIQKLLTDYNLYEGSAHGIYDTRTAEAISRFQEFRGLKPTGAVDPITYCRLQAAAESEVEPLNKPRAKVGLVKGNILISKSVRQLTLFDSNKPLRQYPIAIGKPSTPTPEGNYAIATKILNPGGVLGSRWMGLNFDAYGIHGTSSPWLIGQMVSNGCIRMHNAHAEELFYHVNVGTPVFIRN